MPPEALNFCCSGFREGGPLYPAAMQVTSYWDTSHKENKYRNRAHLSVYCWSTLIISCRIIILMRIPRWSIAIIA